MKEIIKLTGDVIKCLEEQSKKYIETDVDFPTEFVFIHAIERTKRNIRTILILINDDPFKNDHGIGLSIRNILTDLFVIAYLRDYSTNKDDLTTKAYALFNDDIELITKFAKITSGVGQVPIDTHKTYANIIETEGTFLNKIKLESQNFKFPKTTAIYKTYIKDPGKELHQTVINGFDMWSYFSKYEHIGWYSYEVTRNPIIGKKKVTNNSHRIELCNNKCKNFI